MSDELDAASDDVLNQLFYAEVLSREYAKRGGFWDYFGPTDFATNANTVLPWLEKSVWRGTSLRVGGTSAATITVLAGENIDVEITARSLDRSNDFCRAACIALIRTKRASP